MKTIIALPDFTRHAHFKKTLAIALKRLRDIGAREKDAEIIIATGLHKPPSKKEVRKHLGPITDKIKISVHNHGEKHAAYFGKRKFGVPVYLNKKLKGADSIITIGVVEPHLYAGYSGGVKVAAIGLAGEKTINYTHHPRFLDLPGTKLCSINGNPFREFIDDAGRMLPITYSINIINDEKGRLLKIFAGKPDDSFKKAVSYSRAVFEKKINKSFDAVLCDIPPEKAVNIYQSSRPFNYVLSTRKTILKNNGFILVRAGLKDGFGKGLGERRFAKIIAEMKKPEGLIAGIKKRGCLAGEHRAYMTAKAMLKAKLGFISAKAHLYKDKGLPFLFFRDLKEALEFMKKGLKKQPDIYYLKNAFNTILIRSRG